MIIPYGAGQKGTVKSVRARLRGRMFPDKHNFGSPTPLGEAFIAFLNNNFAHSMAQHSDSEGRRIQPLSVHLTELTSCIANAFIFQIKINYPGIDIFKNDLVSSAAAVFGNGQPMIWQAPTGLPVIQRSFHVSQTYIDCRVSSPTFGDLDLSRKKYAAFHERIRFTSQRISNEVHERYQQSGILPNFIHSMDSTHLIKTIQLATERDVKDFTVIHDSYGAHAADMPTLSTCIREAFVNMYNAQEVPPLTRFLQWCAVLSIATRAPQISVDQFGPYIDLTMTEKAMYDMVARWAGRDSTIMQELAREAPKLIDQLTQNQKHEIKGGKNKALMKLLVFAADKIELEWPMSQGKTDLSSCIESKYFFS
jgi:DNA-directed RNA polymerase